jgi:hypothetical protein
MQNFRLLNFFGTFSVSGFRFRQKESPRNREASKKRNKANVVLLETKESNRSLPLHSTIIVIFFIKIIVTAFF